MEDPVKLVVVALEVEVEVQLEPNLPKTVELHPEVVVEAPMGQLQVGVEVEVMRAESDWPMRVEMAEMLRVPMRIRVAEAEALAKPVAVAEVLRQPKRVLVVAVAVRHYILRHFWVRQRR